MLKIGPLSGQRTRSNRFPPVKGPLAGVGYLALNTGFCTRDGTCVTHGGTGPSHFCAGSLVSQNKRGETIYTKLVRNDVDDRRETTLKSEHFGFSVSNNYMYKCEGRVIDQ